MASGCADGGGVLMTKARRAEKGRPRDEAARVAILEAANALIEERGIGGFSIEAVAARAGVAKTTIYRWWPSRGALAIAGFLANTAPQISYEETTSPLDDLRRQIERVAAVYAGKTGRVMAAIIAQGQSDPEAIAAFVEGYVHPRREAASRALQRAIAKGQIRPDIDVEAAIDALYGPMTYRLLVPHAPMTPAWARKLVEHVLDGLRPRARLATGARPPR